MNIKTTFLKIIFLISFIFIIAVFFSDRGICKDGISGRYINMTFLEQLPEKIPGTIPFYCLEINFTDNDSAEIFNGFEEFKLAYGKGDQRHVFMKAVQGNDLHFIFNDSGNILLIDSAWTGLNINSEFRRVSEDEYGSSHKWFFEKYLNEKMLAGDYILSDKSKSSGELIVLTSDGKVTGLRNYSAYSICYSGDCTEETFPVSNTIAFTNDNGAVTVYSFTFNSEKNSVIFRKLSEPVPDIKGEREIQDIAFELIKK